MKRKYKILYDANDNAYFKKDRKKVLFQDVVIYDFENNIVCINYELFRVSYEYGIEDYIILEKMESE